MNNYIKLPEISEVFEELHGLKPQVYQQRISATDINTKIISGKKEIVLKEVLRRGLTKDAFLTYNGVTTRFNSVYEAEQEATKILNSKEPIEVVKGEL